jgi:hypothetical protein
MFSIARSRYTILLQIFFIAGNAIGLFLGTVYNAKTPDLYENNAHHKMGWIFTWIALAWLLLGIFNIYSAKPKGSREAMSVANMAQYERLQESEQTAPLVRWSGDSGQGTERNSASLFGSTSPGPNPEQDQFEDDGLGYSRQELDGEADEAEKTGFLRNTRIDRFLARNTQRFAIGKTIATARVLYSIFERAMIMLAFLALTTGIVTYGGIFVS